MKRANFVRLGILVTFLLLMLTPFMVLAPAALAQDVPAADTPTTEPPTFTPTATTVPPTSTPTPVGPTATAVSPTATPKPATVPIPEPVTVVLFGTGLAALSAAVATRRGKNGKQ